MLGCKGLGGGGMVQWWEHLPDLPDLPPYLIHLMYIKIYFALDLDPYFKEFQT